MSQIKAFDFSNALMRCSALYYLMCPGKTKTPKEQYDYLQLVLADEMRKYDEMGERKQGMANGLKKASKIAGLEYEIEKLEPKKHLDPLNAGAKSYLKRIYAELKYGKWSLHKDKSNKFTEKGKMVQGEAIDLMSKMDGYAYPHNSDRINNEFLTGELDTYRGKSLREADYVSDVKASWDIETFLDVIGKSLNPLYWWQNQGYFALTGAKAGEVSYFLMDTPETLINDEKYYLARDMDVIDQETPEFRLKEAILINNLTFSDIPEAERRFKFEVTRDDDAIARIYQKVPQAREFLNEFQELHLKGVFTDQEMILEPVEELIDVV